MCFSIRNEIVKGSGEKWLIYLTNISYLMLVVHSGAFFLFVLHFKHVPSDKLPANTKWYHSALWLLTTVSFDVAVAVSILYWTLEFKDVLHVQSFMTHIVNSLYVILDLAVISIPVRLVHVIYPILYSTVYLVFTICYHLVDGTNSDGEPYIYRTLNWSNTVISDHLCHCPLCPYATIHVFQFVCFTCRKYLHVVAL
ncbi:hypothetical protein Btru_054870 [Bulinus truncatus]|nr:hypothetical protein Btru_054870 [Bulinus truncatus]